MNPLTDIVPAVWRKRAYALYALLGVVISGTQVGYAATSNGQPEWLTVVLAVYAYLGVALGFTAASNTTAVTSDGETVEEGHVDIGTALLVLIAVVVILIALGFLPK